MKILFIEPYPTEGPSSRYRVEQYIPYFGKNGIRCKVRPFISSKFYAILYKKGHYLRKIFLFLESSVKRFFDLFTALGSDVIFIHLEAFPVGPPVFELILAKLGKKIIYDMDDAIYLGITSSANRIIKYLKYPAKVKTLIKISRQVITCNEYLADYARRYNKNIAVIPTSVDTDRFLPKDKEEGKDITIGWIGSHSTARYLEALSGVFYKLSARHKFNLKIVGAGGHIINIRGIKIEHRNWSLRDDIEQFQSLDIGVYPLPDDEWILGKTGFKTVQYMGVGIPCVVSRVGTNKGIVQDGINGYLATTNEEWVEKLSGLIEDPMLRRRIGLAGRKTVEEKFSVRVNASKYLEIIKKHR